MKHDSDNVHHHQYLKNPEAYQCNVQWTITRCDEPRQNCDEIQAVEVSKNENL